MPILRHIVISATYILLALFFAGLFWIIGSELAPALAIIFAGLTLIAGVMLHLRLAKHMVKIHEEELAGLRPEIPLSGQIIRDLQNLLRIIVHPSHQPLMPKHARKFDSDIPTAISEMQAMAEEITKDRHAEKWFAEAHGPIGPVFQGDENLDIDGAPTEAALRPLAPAESKSTDPFHQALIEAVETESLDIFLSPIVRLPSRRISFFHSEAHIRDSQGSRLTPNQYWEAADSDAIMPLIDRYILMRTVPMIRKLERKNQQFAFFCSLSRYALCDPDFITDLLALKDLNAPLLKKIIFEIPQNHLLSLRKAELAGLTHLAQTGCQFAMGRVQKLNLDFELLNERHIRYIRLPAPLLLQEKLYGGPNSDLLLFRKTLDRVGIDMIIDGLESEDGLKDVLDFGADYGQGHLFGAPSQPNGDNADSALISPINEPQVYSQITSPAAEGNQHNSHDDAQQKFSEPGPAPQPEKDLIPKTQPVQPALRADQPENGDMPTSFPSLTALREDD